MTSDGAPPTSVQDPGWGQRRGGVRCQGLGRKQGRARWPLPLRDLSKGSGLESRTPHTGSSPHPTPKPLSSFRQWGLAKSLSGPPLSCWGSEGCPQMSHPELSPVQGRRWLTRANESLDTHGCNLGPKKPEAKNMAPRGDHPAPVPPGLQCRKARRYGLQVPHPPSNHIKNRTAWRKFPYLFKVRCCPFETSRAELP